jgi:hypothetical protein
MYRQYAGGYPAFRDIAGSWYDGDLDLAVFATREHVYDQVMALTFLEMHTNPNLKWLSSKVSALSADSSRVVSLFKEFTSPDLQTDEAKRAFVVSGIRLVDAVFARCRTLLDSHPSFMSTTRGLELTEQDERRRSVKHPEFEQQIQYRRLMYSAEGPSCEELLASYRACSGRKGDAL